MQIPLVLKERHLVFVGRYIENASHAEWRNENKMIEDVVVSETYAPDDDVPVTIDHNKLVQIYLLMGNRSEREASAVNEEMKNSLIPQIVALQNNPDAEIAAAATDLYNQFVAISTSIITDRNNQDQAYRDRILAAYS